MWFRSDEILREAHGEQDQAFWRNTRSGRFAWSTAMNQRRSERVLLQVRIVVDTTIEGGRHVRLDAFTLVVNAHGGLLEMSLKVPKGHKLLLTNPNLGTQELCHVVAVRGSDDGHFAIAFEFDNPSPQFWPITFPPHDWSVVQTEH